MNTQQLVVTALIGVVAGWLASLIVGGVKGGLVGMLIAGIVGSFVGGFILKSLNVRIGVGNAIVDNIIQSAIGAIVVILVARLFL